MSSSRSLVNDRLCVRVQRIAGHPSRRYVILAHIRPSLHDLAPHRHSLTSGRGISVAFLWQRGRPSTVEPWLLAAPGIGPGISHTATRTFGTSARRPQAAASHARPGYWRLPQSPRRSSTRARTRLLRQRQRWQPGRSRPGRLAASHANHALLRCRNGRGSLSDVTVVGHVHRIRGRASC